jgi:hypothetical protein
LSRFLESLKSDLRCPIIGSIAKSSFVDLDGWKNGGFGLFGVVFKGRLISLSFNLLLCHNLKDNSLGKCLRSLSK